GEKVASYAITEEYAKADPVYVEKTANLPHTYSHYRPIQGDGNCGWRAIAFGYFETLVRHNNQALIRAEVERLVGLNDFIKNVGGIDPYIYEDMVEETFTLLKNISVALPAQDEAMAILLSTFNTPELGNSILYHFRLLASSQFKSNIGTYEPFLASGTPDKYITSTLECPDIEIDHLGLVLLASVLIKPAGFVLEVAYLDRSPGAQANTYRFPEDANGQDAASLGPIIYLLYRPGHYDILYRSSDSDIRVHLSLSSEYQTTTDSYSITGMGTLSMIPGLGFATETPFPMASGELSWPGQSWKASQSMAEPEPRTPVGLGQPSSSVSPRQPFEAHPLRMTKYCQLPEFIENDTWVEPTFTTATFKNSHFNKAHYNNPDFQPEIYNPCLDEDVELPQ
ncbi:cysteine proteinase, partial [Thozetella sp. PMI_491]